MRNGAVNPKIRPPSCGTMRTPSKQGSHPTTGTSAEQCTEWRCWSEETPTELRNEATPSKQGALEPLQFMALGPEHAETCNRVPVDCNLDGSVFWGECHSALSDKRLYIQRRTRQHVRGRVCLQGRGAGALQCDTVDLRGWERGLVRRRRFSTAPASVLSLESSGSPSPRSWTIHPLACWL